MIVALLAISRSLADDDLRLPTWSTEFDAVLVLPDPHAATPLDAELLLADFGTSAPISAGTVDLYLHGPASLQARLTPESPAGTWSTHLAFPDDGTYAGSLTILTPDRSDLLGLPEFAVSEHVAPTPLGFAWTTLLGGVGCGALGGLAFGLALGLGGRRAKAVPPAILALGIIAAQSVYAHGGEDHKAPAAPLAISGGLFFPLDAQFRLNLRTAKATRAADAVVVPDAAIVHSGGEALVFVKIAPEYFVTRPLQLGARSADQREILDGLAEGERVVVHGTDALRSLAGR